MGFKSACKYNLIEDSDIKPYDKKIKEGDTVFMGLYDIDKQFVDTKPPTKITLVLGGNNETFDNSYMKKVKPYVKKVYSQNASAHGVYQNPIGFRDNQYTPHAVLYEVLDNKSYSNKRDTLCLVNFIVSSNEDERSLTRDFFLDKKWASVNHEYLKYDFQKSLHHSHPDVKKMRVEYYKTLKQTKCVICPRGAAVDTHRIYESLFFGCIPVIKTSFLDPMYKKLGGCWIVNSWDEVTEDSCNEKWNHRKDEYIRLYQDDWLIE